MLLTFSRVNLHANRSSKKTTTTIYSLVTFTAKTIDLVYLMPLISKLLVVFNSTLSKALCLTSTLRRGYLKANFSFLQIDICSDLVSSIKKLDIILVVKVHSCTGGFLSKQSTLHELSCHADSTNDESKMSRQTDHTMSVNDCAFIGPQA